jgi:hypothetical protein
MPESLYAAAAVVSSWSALGQLLAMSVFSSAAPSKCGAEKCGAGT